MIFPVIHIYGICILLLVILIGLYIVRNANNKRISHYIENYEIYNKLFYDHLEKAYDIIYKDRILVYSIEGTKPDPKDFKKYSKDFGRLAVKLLGSKLMSDFTFIYGSEEILLFNMIEYFNTRSEEDEIREASINQVMGQDQI